MTKNVGRISSPVNEMIVVVTIIVMGVMRAMVIGIAEAEANILHVELLLTMRVTMFVSIGVMTSSGH